MSAVCPTPGCPNLRPCATHGRDPNAPWSPNRNRAKQATFRKHVLANAGYRCEMVEGDTRCPVHGAKNLRACHRIALADGGSYDPGNGRALCRAHDRQTDRYAR